LHRIDKDIANTNKIISDITGVNPKYFAYPYNEYGQNSKNIQNSQTVLADILANYYQLVFSQAWLNGEYHFNFPSQKPFVVKRIEVGEKWTGKYLIDLLDKSEDKSLDYIDDFSIDNGWVNPWGQYRLSEGRLFLATKDGSTGATVFLDGTYSWRNYRFDADIEKIKGDTVSLLSYYSDDNNYYACNFSDGYVSITQSDDENRTVLAEGPSVSDSNSSDMELSMEISSDKIRCFQQDQLEISTASIVNVVNQNGGIGLKVWSNKPGNAEIKVNSISVTRL
jgi:hypothetical protein